MKQFVRILLICLLALSLLGCSASTQPEAAAQPADAAATVTPEATAAPQVVVFSDLYFEDAVRTALNKPEGDITIADTEALTVLSLANADWDAMNAEDGGIKDISDLKYFSNLTELHLDYNDIHDFSPLSALTNLTVLTFNGVRADSLAPLATLTKMVTLCFDWSYKSDGSFQGYESLDFTKDMQDLEVFEAKKAGIKDISALVGLPKLWSVYLDENLITDISPLAQIKTIKEFLIAGNPIEDFSCLEPLHEVFPNLPAEFVPDVDLN
jgi:hypothetical protein